ncbi:DUF4255 domain-containing protein [Chryseobacterium sp. C-71]|jgi:hypothetical protein|uniref:DUF4255 domain-containing protein n=1 Tax=Chryseobacterium sp. C-71 TaxID=2893882 RepID=UPI001E519525|nr:DUF4255 domain-containing protein [Chryseobacterium sp. C-71]UFH33166.1 DUF4255 domain-containing protein [Chryseobacterium sp. C-71]
MKITEFLSKLVTAVNAEITGIPIVELANIATLNDGDEFLSSKSSIILSIVNIEEDKVMKNQTLYKNYIPSGNTVEKYKNPTQNLILSLLFASYNIDQSKYTEGIDKLEAVIRYFQNNRVFYWQAPDLLEYIPESGFYDKLIFDMVSLKTDQLNQMWSYLGAKYMPSVLYQVQMVSIQAEETSSEEIIKKATIQLWENDPNDSTGHLESGTFTKNDDNEIITTT